VDGRTRVDGARHIRRQRVLTAVALILVAAAGAAVALRSDEHIGHAHAASRIVVSTRAGMSRRASTNTANLRRSSSLALARESRVMKWLVASGLPVFCGGHRGRLVALTFDDGPGPYTPLAVRILRNAGARATFFLVGRNLARFPTYAHSELHVATLGDHTWTHPNLVTLASAQITSELASTQKALEHVAGRPITLFRPPYGQHDPRTQAAARALGMLAVLWSIDSRDSAGADWRRIAANIASAIQPGSIVLMHENRGQTIRALRYLILPMLTRRHLTPVSVPELLARDPPNETQLRTGESACFNP
jgi:peptidoglycan-N-acetylglucosamine deacetylase